MNSDSTAPHQRTLAIAGVGLLGGSIGAAVKQRGLFDHVIGFGRNPDRLRAAVAAGILDSFVTDPADADREWDFAIIGTPVDRIVDDVRRVAECSRPGTLITDVGSVKFSICSELENGLPAGVHFVGSHPLAGSEKRGFEVADPNLFEGRATVVTPTDSTEAADLERVKRFWESLGSRVVLMPPGDHDDALATTSHLPHVVAAALATLLTDDQRQLAATGFRDTTRIAAGDPDLWVAILMGNAESVESSFLKFEKSFGDFRDALRNRDADRLRQLLDAAKTRRDSLRS